MPRYGAIDRRELLRGLRAAGFEARRSGGRHEIMRRGDVTIAIPNAHRGEISTGLLARILRQAGISREEWERL